MKNLLTQISQPGVHSRAPLLLGCRTARQDGEANRHAQETPETHVDGPPAGQVTSACIEAHRNGRAEW